MKTILKFLFVFLLLTFVYESVKSFISGIGGHTRKNAGTVGDGCICHMADSTSGVLVKITGPAEVAPNATNIYRVTMRGGPAVTGGFDFNVKFGNTDTVEGEGTTIIIEDPASLDISHRFPKPFSGDSVSWLVKYIAPDTNVIVYDTLYACGNSTNNDLFPNDSDKWNFSPNFVVKVNPTIGITKISGSVSGFSLMQNYPNPFNPSTNLEFALPEAGIVELKIYDANGKELGVFINKNLNAGVYKFEWNASKYASGVYFYSLSAGKYYSVKKMVLVK
jgi:hypothetical protein